MVGNRCPVCVMRQYGARGTESRPGVLYWSLDGALLDAVGSRSLTDCC